MGDQSAIEWTEATWNPLVGCSRVSEGCRNCYAERTAYRLAAMGQKHYEAVTSPVLTRGGAAWNGKVELVESALDRPLRWKKPRRIFVNSMSDLFHESVPDQWIQRIFEVMLEADQHTYQVLTKRPERMRRWVTQFLAPALLPAILERIWLGVSVEDQATADARIPLLLQTPAAVRWVSYEPALGPVDFRRWAVAKMIGGPGEPTLYGLDWIVVGGESGPGARPFDLAWARQTIAQGKAAGVPVFCKQVGSRPIAMVGPGGWPGHVRVERDDPDGCVHIFRAVLKDRKGGDPAEWPADLRVREYPPTNMKESPA